MSPLAGSSFSEIFFDNRTVIKLLLDLGTVIELFADSSLVKFSFLITFSSSEDFICGAGTVKKPFANLLGVKLPLMATPSSLVFTFDAGTVDELFADSLWVKFSFLITFSGDFQEILCFQERT